jgi:CheY-like chemotaxis protein
MKKDPFHIILADDDATDRLLFKQAFEELKIETTVQMVNDGEQLMAHLAKKNTVLPQLLFLDLNMPLKDGLACLKEIRENEKLKNISIAIYSTSTSEKDKQKTFLLGANIYIQKPDNFNTLKQILEKVITTASIYQNPPFNKENFMLNI